MTGRLVHTGQVVMDLVMRVDSVPETGGDVLASTTTLLPGGGFNVMAAAARDGAPVLYAGAHGTGRFGDQARAALRGEGITIAQPPTEDRDTGVCVVLVDDDGERTFVTGTGAEAGLPPELLRTVEVTPEDVLYLSGYSLLHESNRAALLGWLPDVSVAAVLLDPGPLVGQIPRDVLDTVLSKVDVLSCNARESRVLTGLADVGEAASALTDRLGSHAAVIVRDGPAGCVLAQQGTTRHIPGFPVTPVDTNGAGDTHCGVLAAALLGGADLAAAARRANAAAALSVLRHGPATAPHAAEIDAFLAEH
ncbi:PfkB family carbohydrate kinase [Saccharomonospora viridis]|uniref:Carbohydrate kinase n=1 Tax=Saccharomonospora viridis TaxID=1852 RepID=A0A837DB25_9PSEU|nr:PfkB family carbohydrate kinase [Saccharomonospora viridis]KHF43006.1 carbohydrate kinase [Saccharomonospora viridis]SFO86578.1 Sugar or nucleoside kinase, ribokinase family [Saccharomonospora viridis]